MGHKTLIDGVGYDITGGRCLVDGVGYSIQKGRTMVDGVGYDVAFDNEFTSENIEVGSSVYTSVNGVRTEFLVVHQGLPSSMYDASCDGTWLLMKDIYVKRAWHSSNSNSYKASTINTYLNDTFYNLFSSNTKNKIKTVKIPYVNGTGNGAVASGVNGLSVDVFLLAAREVGFTDSYAPVDGACLSYFNGASSAKRVARYNGSADHWRLRSPMKGTTDSVYLVQNGGGSGSDGAKWSYGIRPAFILDSSAAIDPDTFDILG